MPASSTVCRPRSRLPAPPLALNYARFARFGMSFLLLNGLQAERVDEVGDQRPSDYEDGQEHRRDEDDVAGGVLVVSVVEGVDRSSP